MLAVRELVADLETEQRALQELVATIDEDDWLRPTPAEGWDVRDAISHLAHTDEIAADTVLGGPRSLDIEAARFSTPEEFTWSGCTLGHTMSGAEVLGWWREAASRLQSVFLDADPTARVPWGIGMSLPALVTARIMETWAHGLDVRAALTAPPHDTDTNLAHVAWLGIRALPYAFSVAGTDVPEGELRVELSLPSGAVWTSGPPDSDNRITGPASEFCRLFVQRLPLADARQLTAQGRLARTALQAARAFL